jgi:hypothetical protein
VIHSIVVGLLAYPPSDFLEDGPLSLKEIDHLLIRWWRVVTPSQKGCEGENPGDVEAAFRHGTILSGYFDHFMVMRATMAGRGPLALFVAGQGDDGQS